MNRTFTGPSLLDVLSTLPLGRYLWPAVRLPLALGLAALAQARFIAERSDATGGVILLIVAASLFLLSLLRDGWAIPRGEDCPAPGEEAQGAALGLEAEGAGEAAAARPAVRWFAVSAGVVLSALTYIIHGSLTFTPLGVVLWIASVAAWVYAFWEGDVDGAAWARRGLAWLRAPALQFRLTASHLLVLGVVLVAAYARFDRLDAVPPEMTSDHVEKLLDVNDVLNGERPLFFPRNTGREPFQFYLSALIAGWLGTGPTFLTLKIGAALMGVLTIPFIYLLGRELGDETLGLIAGALAAVALWPQTITRVGLRFPYGPVFVAPLLFFLLRGLRRGNRNDFLIAGLILGAGLYGYTSFRIVPVAAIAFGFIYLLWARGAAARLDLAGRFAMLTVTAAAVFVPLFRYTVAVPEMFWYRTLGRVAETETQLPGPPLQIFLLNQWNALRMFNWTSDQVWVNTVPGRPVLDTLAGGVFVLGAAYLVYRFARRRQAVDLALLLSVPILLLPSTLSIAFPHENPSVVRTAGAIPVVFLIAAFPLRLLVQQMRGAFGARYGRVLGAGLVAGALVLSAREMLYEYFVEYPQQYIGGAQNASELGAAVRGFAESVGTYETVWVKAYPYWVDTRAVGMYAGRFGWDNVYLEPEELAQTVAVPGTKMIIVKAEDLEAIAELRRLYPNGVLTYHPSRFIGKDFLTFLAPAVEDFDEGQLPPPPG